MSYNPLNQNRFDLELESKIDSKPEKVTFAKKVPAYVAGATAGFIALGTTAANAALTLPTAVDTDTVLSWAGIILVGIAAIWPIKKLIALGNKS